MEKRKFLNYFKITFSSIIKFDARVIIIAFYIMQLAFSFVPAGLLISCLMGLFLFKKEAKSLFLAYSGLLASFIALIFSLLSMILAIIREIYLRILLANGLNLGLALLNIEILYNIGVVIHLIFILFFYCQLFLSFNACSLKIPLLDKLIFKIIDQIKLGRLK